jgi:PAS domain S-box-containing protein
VEIADCPSLFWFQQWQDLEINLLQQLAVQLADWALAPLELTELYQQLQVERQRRQEIEAKLQANERFFRRFYDREENLIFLVNVLPSGKFRFVDFNSAYERLTGLRSEDAQNKSPEQVFSPAVAAAVSANYTRCLQLATTLSYEECLSFQGEESWWLTTLTPLQDEQLRVYGLIGSSINITRRKRTEEKLRKQDEFLRYIIDANPNLIFVKNWEGKFTLVNQALADLYGTTVKDLIGKTDAEFNPDSAEVEQFLAADRKVMTTLEEKIIPEESVTLPTGGIRWFQTIKKPLIAANGQARQILGVATEITKRKRAEQERDRLFQQLEQQNQTLEAQVQERMAQLRQEMQQRQRVEEINALLATAVEYAGDAIELTNSEFKIEYVNPAFEEITGYTRAEVLGKTPASLFHTGHHSEAFYQAISDTLAEGQVWRGNLISKRQDGSLCDQEVTISPVWGSTGVITQYVAVRRDVTERKRVEEELRRSEERWQLVIEGNNQGIWDLNLKTNKVFRSARYKEMLGYADHELEDDNDDWSDRIHPDDFDRVMQANRDYLERKTPGYAVEYRLRCKDGSYKWVLGRAQAVWDEAGSPVRMVGSTTDISDAYRQATLRKQAEEALRKSEQQFRQIFQNAPIAISVADFQTHKFIRVNPAYTQLLGYTTSELTALTFDQISYPEDLQQDLEGMEQITQGMLDSYHLEKRFLKKNGAIIWTNMTVSVVPDQDGRPNFSIAMIEDITERRQLQVELLTSEERWRTSLENMLDCFGIYTSIRDESGKIVDFLIEYVNRAVCDFNGMTKEQQMGKRMCELVPNLRNTTRFEQYCQIVETGQPLIQESLVYRETVNGKPFGATLDIRAVKLGDGFACAWRDVTERKQAEDKIKASLLEKETLLKEIHHRVKNNLQIISSLLRLQSRQIRDRQALQLFTESQNRVQAMALIHEKLYRSSNLAKIDFEEYIKTLVEELFRGYDARKRSITFNANVDRVSLAIALAIPCGLIINELVTNCLKYAFGEAVGGQISISLQERVRDQFILTISDNGVGLPEDLNFRNTNSLGLQLVCRLTKQLEGTIELDRSQGTKFKIVFATPSRDREG